MVDSLDASDTHFVLDECGLGSISNAIESMKAVYIEGMIASSHPGLSQDSLKRTVETLYTSLVDPPIHPFPITKALKIRCYEKMQGIELGKTLLRRTKRFMNWLSGKTEGTKI